MKRPIKFRGQTIDTRQWVYGSLIQESLRYGSRFSILTMAEDEDGEDVKHEVYFPTVGQYTGMKDKNGKDVYEGDWLQAPGYACYVVFKDGGFMSIYSHPEDGEELAIMDLGVERFQIIGNIYVNH